MKNALTAFQKYNKCLPEHIILYRDGVGDTMRKKVVKVEVKQLKEAIYELYNQASKKPYFTTIFVNKIINQRFFVENRNELENPPAGCLIDSNVVESEDSNIEYDFYLVPQ